MAEQKRKKTSKYWQKRFDQIEQSANEQSVAYYNAMQEKYRKAELEISNKINIWYQRLADNNGVSITEAKRMLNASELKEFRWNVEEYIKYGQKNAIDGQWMKQLENASAKAHINRLEALKLETRQQVEALSGGIVDDVDTMLKSVYKDTYYHSIFEMQKGNGIGFDFSKVDDKKLSTLMRKPWAADGTNFSDKLWTNKTKLISNLDQELSRMVLTGKSPKDAIKNIAKHMHTSQSNSARLVMTEQAYFTTQAQKESFKELDVEEYEVVSTLDNLTCSDCGNFDGQHFPIEDMEVGVNAPPFHPYCRCTTCPYFEDTYADAMRASRDAEGKTVYEVPEDMTYREWASHNNLMAKNSIDKDNKSIHQARENEWNEEGKLFNRIRFKTNDKDTEDYVESKRPLANFRALTQNNVVNVLRKESEEWIKKLSSLERNAITKYTYNSGDKKPNRFFERLNAMLRGDFDKNEKLMEYADIISGAINKNKLKHDVICYRKMDFNPYTDYPIGEIFIEKQFISTSVVESGTMDKLFKIVIFVPEKSRGAYIENISKYPKQRELLLDKGTKLRILSKQEDMIILEVIG